MTDTVMTDIAVKPKTPWWVWLVGVIGVLWSLGGCFDYVMTQTQNAEYLADIPQPLLNYWYGLPGWLTTFWALAVWGGLAGWVLVLARSRFAVTAFAVSLVSMLLNFGWSLFDGGLALQAEHLGAGMAYGFTALIVAGAVFALWFARALRRRGVLG